MGLVTIAAAVRRAAASSGGGGSWQLAAGHFVPAKMAPVIIHPRPDAETNAYARCCRAPSAILWRIPIVVLGGAWPFKYEILDAPSGVTLTETIPADWVTNGLGDYGILEWANPTVGTHDFSVLVTDQDGTPVQCDWTLEVIDRTNTTYFLFVDAATGSDSTGDGSFGNPFQTMNGWYLSNKNNSTYSGRQVFYRAGTYAVSIIGGYGGDSWQADWAGTVKPRVHVAYPGESVTIDGDGAYIDIESGGATPGDFCWQGFNFINPEVDEGGNARKQFIRSSTSACARSLFFENNFDGNGQTTSGSNSSCVMFTGGAGSYSAICRNTFNDCDGMDFGLYYDTYDHVAEGNLITGTYASVGGQDPWGFFIKGGGTGDARFSIRANRSQSNNISRPLAYCSEFTGQLKEDVEVCWNSYKSSNSDTINEGAGCYALGQGSGTSTSNYGAFWSYRNNWHNPHLSLINIDAGGPFVFENDVIHHSGTYTDGIYIFDSAALPAALTKTDLATGTSMLDASTNLLTGAARTTYLGTHGCEVA